MTSQSTRIYTIEGHMTIREAILSAVDTHQGLKGVDLVVKVMGLINPTTVDHVEFQHQLQILVNNRELVELNYELPKMDYRMKSIYFPKGTKLHYMV